MYNFFCRRLRKYYEVPLTDDFRSKMAEPLKGFLPEYLEFKNTEKINNICYMMKQASEKENCFRTIVYELECEGFEFNKKPEVVSEELLEQLELTRQLLT